jgi:taurine dioxygenase
MQLRRAAGALGAFVTRVDLAAASRSSALVEEIRAALHAYEVLCFRDQRISPQEQRAFAACLGSIEGHPAYPVVPGTADVQVLESTAEKPSKIELWHSDMTFRARPPRYTMLHGKVIPDYGGDTLFASTTAAYAALSVTYRHFVDSLTATHDFAHGFKESLAEPGGYERLRGAIADNPPVSHPVVRTHEDTKRRALYVNCLFTTRINELSPGESRSVLDHLFAFLTTPEFTVRIPWEPETLVVWDNRSTQHKPVNDFLPQHRKHHRITVVAAAGR